MLTKFTTLTLYDLQSNQNRFLMCTEAQTEETFYSNSFMKNQSLKALVTVSSLSIPSHWMMNE